MKTTHQYDKDSVNNALELATFRTELCCYRNNMKPCYYGEDCAYSHCISWARRNPYVHPYKSTLCPNTFFWYENNKMRVKTWCKRRRNCLYSHTKEEQMYHPEIYKTKMCRAFPSCNKSYCPFAHGITELRFPEITNAYPLVEGPEMYESPLLELLNQNTKVTKNPRKVINHDNAALLTITNWVSGIILHPQNQTNLLIFEQDGTIYTGSLTEENVSILNDGMVSLKIVKSACQ